MFQMQTKFLNTKLYQRQIYSFSKNYFNIMNGLLTKIGGKRKTTDLSIIEEGSVKEKSTNSGNELLVKKTKKKKDLISDKIQFKKVKLNIVDINTSQIEEEVEVIREKRKPVKLKNKPQPPQPPQPQLLQPQQPQQQKLIPAGPKRIIEKKISNYFLT